jgi:hypothetical protein
VLVSVHNAGLSVFKEQTAQTAGFEFKYGSKNLKRLAPFTLKQITIKVTL